MRGLLLAVVLVGCSGTAPVSPVIVDAGAVDAGCGGYLQACCPGAFPGEKIERCGPDIDGGPVLCCGSFGPPSTPGRCSAPGRAAGDCAPPAD